MNNIYRVHLDTYRAWRSKKSRDLAQMIGRRRAEFANFAEIVFDLNSDLTFD